MSSVDKVIEHLIRRLKEGDWKDVEQLCDQNPELADSVRQLSVKLEAGRRDAAAVSKRTQADVTAPIDSSRPRSSDEASSKSQEFDVATVGIPGDGQVDEGLPEYATTDRYRVDREIDRGGMGVILRVWDESLKRTVAMKVIRTEEQAGNLSSPAVSTGSLSRFIREAEITGHLDHPGVVPVHEIGRDRQGRLFFTMRLIKGESLAKVNRRVLENQPTWSVTRALEVIVKVCDTVAYAHNKGIIHRDLKPANIMVGAFGETYVMDWGLAKVVGESEPHRDALDELTTQRIVAEGGSGSASGWSHSEPTMDGSVIGTPAYMSPEQAMGKISELDASSDIYSVGAMLYELLAGVKPYGDAIPPPTAREILIAVANGSPTPVAEIQSRVSPELIAICEKAMSRNPSDRYADMREMAADLRAYLENRVVKAHRTGAYAELKKWVKRNRSVALAGAIVALVVVVGLMTVIDIQRRSTNRIQTEKEGKERALVKEKEARKTAEAQRRLVEGLYFEREAEVALRENRPATANLLAMESLERAPSHEARSILVSALHRNSEVILIDGHRGEVFSARYSPDGQQIISAAPGDLPAIWDATSGACRSLLVGHSDQVVGAAFNHDGRLAITAGYDRAAIVWDVQTGQQLHRLECNEPLSSVGFSPDGSRIVTADYENVARLWDTASGQLLHSLQGHTKDLPFVSFSRDGTQLLTGSNDTTVRVWNVASGDLLSVIEGHGSRLSSVRFSPDGQQVVTSATVEPNRAGDVVLSSACLWDAKSGKLLKEITLMSPASSLDYSPDGDQLAIGTSDGKLTLWHVESEAAMRTLESGATSLQQVQFSSDGERLLAVTLDHEVIVWNPLTGHTTSRMQGHSKEIRSAAFSPDGSRVVTASRDGSIRVWRSDQNVTLPEFRHAQKVVAARLSPKSQRLLTFTGDELIPHLWSIPERRLLATLTQSTYRQPLAEFDSKDRYLLTTSSKGESYLWSATDGSLIHTFAATGPATTAVFDPDGQSVLIGSHEAKKVTKWDVRTGGQVRSIDLKEATTQILCPDGRHLLVGSNETEKLKLWDVDENRVVWVFESEAPFVNSRFTEDGQIVGLFEISGAGLQLRRTSTGEELISLKGEQSPLDNVIFSPDGKFVFGFSSQERVCIHWELSTGKEVRRFSDPDARMDRIVAVNQRRLVTQASNNTTRLWSLETGLPIAVIGSNEIRLRSLRFSRDGKFLVAGQTVSLSTSGNESDVNDSVSVWDAETGELVLALEGQQLLKRADLSPQGSWLVTVPQDHPSHVRFSPLDPFTLAKSLLGRQLSVEERELHRIGSVAERNSMRRLRELSLHAEHLRVLSSLRRHNGLAIQTDKLLEQKCGEVLASLGSNPTPSELQIVLDAVEQFLSDSETEPPPVTQLLEDLERFEAKFMSPP